jgi:hypothetical protein
MRRPGGKAGLAVATLWFSIPPAIVRGGRMGNKWPSGAVAEAALGLSSSLSERVALRLAGDEKGRRSRPAFGGGSCS